jgi:hypothetical protein
MRERLHLVVGIAVAVAFAWPACSSFKNQSAGSDDAGPGDSAAGDAGGADTGAADGPGSTDGPAKDAPHGDSGTASDSATADTGAGDDGSSGDGGTGCTEGGGCPIEVLVDNLNQATLVRVDANNLYFGDEGSIAGTVYQCPKTGCTTPITLGPGYATGLGVDGTNVYWNDFSGGTIVSCAIGGCANMPTVIAPSQPQAEGLTFDGTNLYWASSGNVMTCLPPGCATRTTLAPGQSTAIVQVASETDVAYWMSNGSVRSCPAAGCGQTPATLVAATGSSIVVKNGMAYFTSGNAVVSCPVGGCATPHTIGSSDDPYGLGTDGVDVYWLDDIDEVVYRCPVTGCSGGPTHFADGQLSQPGANVALDGEYAYWTTPPQVLRKHK